MNLCYISRFVIELLNSPSISGSEFCVVTEFAQVN